MDSFVVYDINSMTEKEIMFATLMEIQGMRLILQESTSKAKSAGEENTKMVERLMEMLPADMKPIVESVLRGGTHGK